MSSSLSRFATTEASRLRHEPTAAASPDITADFNGPSTTSACHRYGCAKHISTGMRRRTLTSLVNSSTPMHAPTHFMHKFIYERLLGLWTLHVQHSDQSSKIRPLDMSMTCSQYECEMHVSNGTAGTMPMPHPQKPPRQASHRGVRGSVYLSNQQPHALHVPLILPYSEPSK